MKIVYIAHPISGDIEKNLKQLRKIVRQINLSMPGIVPFVPYYVDIVSMDDSNIYERQRGILNDKTLIEKGFIDEMWLTGEKISKGMQAEKELAESLNIPIINLTGEVSWLYL